MPDFTAFKSLDWDPHLYRLVSTFFDPTFTGLIYLFFLISNFPITHYSLLIFGYIAMALTYSRSTLLSFFAASVYFSFIKKNYKYGLISFLIIISTILLLPRHQGEGTKLERISSIYAKLENYQQGIDLYLKSPLIGTGYNRLPQIRTDLAPSSHAIGGFDSSLLTILVTTGLPGLILFFVSLILLFLQSNHILKICLIALLLHSLFANSLLYPYLLVYLLFLRS